MPHALKQFIKYVIVGGSGVLLDLVTFTFFTEVVLFLPWIAVACNQLIVIGYNFSLNKYWSFRNTALPHWQFFRYMTLAIINYLVGVGVMYLFNQLIGINPYIVRLSTIMLSVSWNFLLYKYWVFTHVTD
jgi:dolichol-phosphate mannosyltransferase